MIRFFCPEIANHPFLPESDSGHCIRVLRKHAGDVVQAVDGKGHVYSLRLLDEHAKHTAVAIEEVFDEPKVWPQNITVAVAPTKHMDRMEWLVEKLVEIGVDRIVPVLCQRSERRDIKVERLNRIAVSAMKQSLKATLPIIDPMTPLPRLIESLPEGPQRFVGYCDDNTPRTLLARAYQPAADAIILIGPEGDFTPDEIASLIDARFMPVTLGDNRLRTETAALVAADTFHIITQAAATS